MICIAGWEFFGEMDLDHIEFNSQNDIKQITKELRKNHQSLINRLQSIIYDYKFIKSLNLSHYPLIPNERCGTWYLPSNEYCTTTYFKSTDGHTNEWKFSYRRLNLHLIPIIKDNGGVVIIDSTRRGKPFPDALLKTIPIWCAVINCLVFGVELDQNCYLRFPDIIPKTEKTQIIQLIPLFVQEVKRLNLFKIELDKPLMPYWIYPNKTRVTLSGLAYHVVCLSASDTQLETIRTRNDNGEVTAWQYIQGSGDDHELWIPQEVCSGKFNPEMLWNSMDQITDSTGYINLTEEQLIFKLNSSLAPKADSCILFHQIKNTGIYFGSIYLDFNYDLDIDIENLIIFSKKKVENVPKTIKYFHYPLENNKKGSKNLRDIFPQLIPQLNTKILILCDDGKDLSVSVVIILLIQYFDLNLQPLDKPGRGNKDLVKQFLNLVNQYSSVNPSRNTLQSINSYLMR